VSTLLLTPGGQAPQGSQVQEQAGQTANQLVLPSNANIQTIVIPPCTQPEQSASSSQQSPPQKNLVLPADSRTKSATAPACTVQQSS
jgi:hypothetical protein